MDGKADRGRRASDALVEVDRQVESFRQAREARRLELIEDYVELIADLIRRAARRGRSTSRPGSGSRSRPSPRC